MIDIKVAHWSKKVFVVLKQAQHEHSTGITEALYDIGDENVRFAQNLLDSPPKTGKIYNYPRLGIYNHQASAPGQAPANITKNLRENIDYTVHGFCRMEFGVKGSQGYSQTGGYYGGTNFVTRGTAGKDGGYYGAYLEFGTRKMKPRPFLQKTVDQRNNANAIRLLELVDRRVNR